jgi:hypothetical protein
LKIWSRTPEYNQSVTSIIKKKNLMNINFDIGITTFSKRFDFVENLVNKIRNLGVNNNIFLCINGEKDGVFNEEYRKKILTLCVNHPNIYPIFFVETRGLSKMWNTLIIHSIKDNILLLNDDIEVFNDNMFQVVSSHIESPEYYGLSKINSTFSFFVVNKELIHELGYFDERLIGFGEEDGDITFRMINKKGRDVYHLYAQGITNIVSDIRHDHIKPGVGKYSWFNRNFTFNEKYNCNGATSGISGMFGVECDQVLPDEPQYPYEKFFRINKHNL